MRNSYLDENTGNPPQSTRSHKLSSGIQTSQVTMNFQKFPAGSTDFPKIPIMLLRFSTGIDNFLLDSCIIFGNLSLLYLSYK